MARRKAAADDPPNGLMDLSTMERWLWDAACSIRGAMDAPKFKDYILPLIFYKRLSDAYDDRVAEQVETFGDVAKAREVIRGDHADALKGGRTPIVRFYVPDKFRWEKIEEHPLDRLGEFVTDAMKAVAKANPELEGTLDVIDYAATQAGSRILDDDALSNLIGTIGAHRLGLADASPDLLGHAYEYLLRKFAEGAGQTAGEFYTPMEVGRLMARLLDPRPMTTAHDPACGSAGLLIKLHETFRERHPDEVTKAPKLHGQERIPATFALAKMNMILHGLVLMGDNDRGSDIAIGDTLKNPQFATEGGGLRTFDYVVANPMWNQDGYDAGFYDADGYGRFERGVPNEGSADWGWVQHITACLNDAGRAAVVLDTGAVSRGSGSKNRSAERDIRRRFVEDDLIEGVVLLPENLFYNTTAPGIVLLLNRAKPADRQEEILLIHAAQFAERVGPKNRLTAEGIEQIADAWAAWEDRDGLCAAVDRERIEEADYNLIPSQFVKTGVDVEHRPLPDILADIADAKAERERADERLGEMLASLDLAVGSVA